MIVVGLTGGIGSGKSTVAAGLTARGAVVIDADAITRELQEPGQSVFDAIVERFGEDIVADDGRLDRAALADLVFSDAGAKADLEGLVHPEVGKEIARRMGEVGSGEIVVLDVPLLVETGRDDLAGTIVVDTPPDLARERLVGRRGMRDADVRARQANQASRDERLARADFVLANDGSEAALDDEVARCWTWMQTLADPAEGG